MTKALAVVQPTSIADASPLLDVGLMDAMLRLANIMAIAKTVPAHLQNSPGDCLRVIELAHRCNQSPFALADHCFLTGGKLAMDGQAMMALINASPKVVGSLAFRYSGAGKERRVVCSGKLAGESEMRDVEVTLAQGLADSKGARARWENDSDQMLAYYAARKWARRHAPEVMMGLYTPDEIQAAVVGEGTTLMRDITPPAAAPAASPHAEVEAALASRTYVIVDQDGEVIDTALTWSDALKAYGLAKQREGQDPQAVAAANINMLRAILPHTKGGTHQRLRAEIEAAEVVATYAAADPTEERAA